MTCKACTKHIENSAKDPLWELCNKCYNISQETLVEILDNNLRPKHEENK